MPNDHDAPRAAFALWWESLSSRTHFLLLYPIMAMLVFAGHEAFFPHLTVWRSASYAIFEAIIPTGLVMLATIHERAQHQPPPG